MIQIVKWVCLKMVSTPLYPMVLLIIIPMKNGYFIGNIPNIFRQTQILIQIDSDCLLLGYTARKVWQYDAIYWAISKKTLLCKCLPIFEFTRNQITMNQQWARCLRFASIGSVFFSAVFPCSGSRPIDKDGDMRMSPGPTVSCRGAGETRNRLSGAAHFGAHVNLQRFCGCHRATGPTLL